MQRSGAAEGTQLFNWKCVVSHPSFCHQNILHSVPVVRLPGLREFFLFKIDPDLFSGCLHSTLYHLIRAAAAPVQSIVKFL